MYNVHSVYLILKDDNVNRTIKQLWNENTKHKLLPNGIDGNKSMMAVSGARLTGCSPKYFSIK